jgi:putative DNA primase/helicase
MRWGTHGSMALDVARGVFYDHEGGGARWFLHRHRSLDEMAIDEWLTARHYISVDGRRHNGRVHASKRKIVATYDYTDTDGTLLFQVVADRARQAKVFTMDEARPPLALQKGHRFAPGHRPR